MYRYANMLNITFMTLMYGTALPLLYPIALLAFLFLYIQDHVYLVYLSGATPNYDKAVNARFLTILKCAPAFMLGIGFW
jgi:hypothetical protein